MAHFVTAALSRFTYVLIILVFSLFSLPLVASRAGTGAIALPEFPTAEPVNPAPQSSAITNLVGYDAQAMTLLAGGQAVRIEFVGSSGVWPETAAGMNLQGEQVNFAALWNGIDLVVLNTAGGGVTALFTVAPFADPGQIQLSTSAALEIQPDGSNAAWLPGGRFTITAPRAWQDIGGTRVIVNAGHVVSGSQVGSLEAFHLGVYDPAYPLVIEVDFGG